MRGYFHLDIFSGIYYYISNRYIKMIYAYQKRDIKLEDKMNRAVIFFSLTNNTKEAAEYIAEKTGADLFQIELAKPMPDSFEKQMLIGGMQSSLGIIPKIKEVPMDIEKYDEIILGTPIWAGKASSPVNALLKKYNVADKVTAVFTFSGGGDNDKCIWAFGKVLKNMKANVALADRKSDLSGSNQEKIDKFVAEIN